MLMYLFFKKEDDLFYFCERIFRKKAMIDVKWEKTLHQYYRLQMDVEAYTQEEVVEGLTDLFTTYYLHQFYIEAMEHIFFIQDDATIADILQMIEHIEDEAYFFQQIFSGYHNMRHVVQTYIKHYVEKETSIYVDAMIRFHFSPLRKQCARLVGFAIDERKREE